jgi:uncharacterized protein YaeQ
VALGATVYAFEVALNDADRGVYEALAFRVARHPSEHEAFLATRVLAYCLEYTEGLSFSRGGLSDPDEPALAIRDLTGVLQAWIEVGSPEAARLHRAAKASPRVAVYPHRDTALLLGRLRGETIHRAREIEIREIDPTLIAGVASALDRRMSLELAISDGHLYLSTGATTLDGPLSLHSLT